MNLFAGQNNFQFPSSDFAATQQMDPSLLKDDAFTRRISSDAILIEEPPISHEFRTTEDQSLKKPKEQMVSFHTQCVNHAQAFNGVFLKKLHKKKIFLFLCELGHKFFLTKKEIQEGSWCNTCRKTFQNLKRFARENRGELLDHKIEKTVHFRCEAGHTWHAPCRKAFWHWCKDCSKNTKQMLKELNRQENKRIEQEKIFRQVG